jgi:hypothetical protein
MTDEPEDRLTLRQADAARADLYAIHDELDFIREQIARLPTRKDLARVALLAALGGAALALAGDDDWRGNLAPDHGGRYPARERDPARAGALTSQIRVALPPVSLRDNRVYCVERPRR